jgi:anaerobic magnesium-protoporphyrin IX monomethyl ester cyclase
MKATLISLDHELFCIGIRILSECLRKAGHETQLVFMVPQSANNQKDKFGMIYGDSLLLSLRELVDNSDLIGLSLMSNQFVQAIQVTDYLKSHGVTAPIIWGGVQPTVEPDECIKHADAICLGEGEGAIVDLLNRMDVGLSYYDTLNMWFNTVDGVVRRPLRPLIQDLDRIPFPDFSCQGHFVATQDRLVELTIERFRAFGGERFHGTNESIPYMFMTSRGCPFSCTYCANTLYKSLYQGQRFLRWRSAEKIVEELRAIQHTLGPISYIYMVDDNFTARPKQKLKAFCELYAKEIGIPFYAQVSPLTISNEKMEILFNSGCSHITMGVETASSRTAAIYNRSREHRKLRSAIELVEKYRHKMNPPPTYQFIIDNPYETVDEMLETLRLAVSFPRPWYNPIYSLMLFPGTPLFQKTLEEGIIENKHAQIYTRDWKSQSIPFFQFWIKMYRANVSPSLLKLLLTPWIAKLLCGSMVTALLKVRPLRRLWESGF